MNKFSSAAVNLSEDDSVPSVCSNETQKDEVKQISAASTAVVNLEGSSSVRPTGQRKKSVAKRLSPQNDDKNDDENAPIKLLKRVVKIEKIT
jgi:hypothetical protein